MGGINFSPILFILSKKLYLCIKQELFGRIATQFTEFMTVAKSLPRSLRNTYKLLISNSFLFIYRILYKNTDTKRGEKHVNHVLCLRLRFTRCDNVGLLF